LTSATVLSRDAEFGSGVFMKSGFSDVVTLYGYAGSTTEAYAKENGNKFVALEEPEEENTLPIFTHFGQYNGCTREHLPIGENGLKEYRVTSITIDGVTYNVADPYNHDIYQPILMYEGYLANYYYTAFNLNENNEITAAATTFGTVCGLDGWDPVAKVIDTDLVYLTPVGNQTNSTLPGGSYYVSDIVADSFPLDKIGNWIGDQVRVYTFGEQVFKVIHITKREGVVTSYDKNNSPNTVYINNIPYKVAADELLYETIESPFVNGSQYIKDAECTLYDDVIVEVVYVNQKLDPEQFNEYIYHAKVSLDPNDEHYPTFQNYLIGERSSPAKDTVNSCKETAFAAEAAVWSTTTNIFDALIEGPAGTMYNESIKQKDIYTAIILASLETSYKEVINDSLDEVAKYGLDMLSLPFEIHDTASKYKTWKEIDFKSLNSATKDKLKGQLKTYVKDKFFHKSADSSDVFSMIDVAFKTADCIETITETVSAYCKIRMLNAEMKTVIEYMYEACPSSNQHLKDALSDCVKAITLADDKFKGAMLKDSLSFAGAFAGVQMADFLWGCCGDILGTFFPVVNAIKIAYSAGKMLLELATGIKQKSEAYYRLTSLLNYQELARRVLDNLGNQFENSQTEANAKLYLEAARMGWQILKTDANYTVDFFKTFKYSASDLFNSEEIDSLISTYTNMYQIYSEFEVKFDVLWIDNLREDYPELVSEYEYRMYNAILKLEEITVACPVNVYVYDESNKMVAYVVDGKPYATDNVSVFVEGEKKHFDFYDDQEYRIECEGYDTGDVDIVVTQYDENGAVARSLNYIDLPIDSLSSYSVEMGIENAQVEDNNGQITAPNYDSNNKGKPFTVQIFNGFATSNNTHEHTFTAYPGEIIDISSFIKENHYFAGWTSDNPSITFEDSDALATNFVMVDSDVVIYAEMIEYLPGDINDDSMVDIDDALLLFQNSILPETYPVDYPCIIDFTKDGKVDIDDALLLFQYSILPDVYPIS